MTHLFIINPAAGSKNRTGEYTAKIQAACESRDLRYQIQVSQAPGDCFRLARAAAETGGEEWFTELEHDVLCGGDGTGGIGSDLTRKFHCAVH